jgi:hypothetical protein
MPRPFEAICHHGTCPVSKVRTASCCCCLGSVSRLRCTKQSHVHGAQLTSTLAAPPTMHIFVFHVLVSADMSLMFLGANAFDINLCAWGSRVPMATTNGTAVLVDDMFVGTKCRTVANPKVDAVVPGPFCSPCSSAAALSGPGWPLLATLLLVVIQRCF